MRSTVASVNRMVIIDCSKPVSEPTDTRCRVFNGEGDNIYPAEGQ